MREVILLLPLLALWTGCTEGGLAEQGYRGEPLARIGVYDPMKMLVGQPDVRVGVFWFTRGLAGGEDALSEQPGSRAIGGNSSFVVPLFDPPAEELILPTERGGRLAAGAVAAYHDVDGDGVRGGGEPFAGSVRGRLVLYLADDHDVARSPSAQPLSAGYHYMRAPMLCRVVSPPEPGDCGVPLSAHCGGDADCGGGTCLTRLALEIPGGACAVPEPPPAGCRPGDGTFLVAPMASSGPVGYYLRRCISDTECTSPGESCDVDNYLCSPNANRGPLVAGQPLPPPCVKR